MSYNGLISIGVLSLALALTGCSSRNVFEEQSIPEMLYNAIAQGNDEHANVQPTELQSNSDKIMTENTESFVDETSEKPIELESVWSFSELDGNNERASALFNHTFPLCGMDDINVDLDVNSSLLVSDIYTNFIQTANGYDMDTVKPLNLEVGSVYDGTSKWQMMSRPNEKNGAKITIIVSLSNMTGQVVQLDFIIDEVNVTTVMLETEIEDDFNTK